jgi:HTH-type transcriptional regulator/antitoxin HigA
MTRIKGAKTNRQTDSPSRSALPETFRDLVGEHVPGLIHDDIGHRNAAEMLKRVMRAPKPLNSEQVTYGKLLAHLIQDYERTRYPRTRPKVSGREALGFMMGEHGLTGADIARLLNVTRGMVSRILSGERSLSWEHAKVLAQRLGVTPDVFMEP